MAQLRDDVEAGLPLTESREGRGSDVADAAVTECFTEGRGGRSGQLTQLAQHGRRVPAEGVIGMLQPLRQQRDDPRRVFAEVIVLPKQVANLSVDNANLTMKAGAEAFVTVKVQRLFEYTDAFKVELVVPPNAKALSVENPTIAPGANEAKLKLKVAPGTPPMNVQNLVLKATAVVNGNVNLEHETKINVNIVK